MTCITIGEIKEILDANVLCGEDLLAFTVHLAYGSDMMSEVLAFVKDTAVLLTGLCNPQVIRTAEMLDIQCIVFVRGKVPDEEMINMAKVRHICLMTTEHKMLNSCGMLYAHGLRSI